VADRDLRPDRCIAESGTDAKLLIHHGDVGADPALMRERDGW
jgi:hypothetical protein